MNPEDAILRMVTEMRQEQIGIVERLSRIEGRLDSLQAGFPGGDIEGHRRYHEAVIERAEAVNKMLKDTLWKISQGGIIVFLLALCALAWQWIKLQVKS